MAINDNDRSRFGDRATDRPWIPIGLGVFGAVILGWWLFTGVTDDRGTARTSAPATNQTDTVNTNSPGTSKQP